MFPNERVVLQPEARLTRLAVDDHGGFFLYWNNVYNNLNTNKGYLLGNWVARDGRGLSVHSTYWQTYNIPLIGGLHSDVTTSLKVTYTPHWRLLDN